jgi:hypothetical protein
MKMHVFWDAAPCSLVEIALMMEAVSNSETSVNFYEITRRNIPDDSYLLGFSDNTCNNIASLQLGKTLPDPSLFSASFMK